MRTSKISQDTARLINALSTPRSTRSTRSATDAIRGFTNGAGNLKRVAKTEEDLEDTRDTSAMAFNSADIEDAISGSEQSHASRKRKRGADSGPSTVGSTALEPKVKSTPRKSSRKQKVEDHEDVAAVDVKEEDVEFGGASSPSRAKAKPKIPARKTVGEDGLVTIHPPSNWEEIYSIIQVMREKNPTAPVDTMGCEDLYWRSAPPKEKRYHTLTALMLSSQTKDTVTAAAMQRLHTEVVPRSDESNTSGETLPSTLTIENILASDPKHLDSLIGKVGFHNNKTRYIKQTAEILKSQYDSDIPSTIEGLISLPGVGPKMAYLCLSAAWGVTEGIGVDVHVHRITNLWGWHKTKNPEETRAWLEGWLPTDRWHHINKMLVGLGQLVCLPVGRKCYNCDLAGTGLCKAEIRGLKVKEEKKKVEAKAERGDVVKEETEVKVKEELVEP